MSRTRRRAIRNLGKALTGDLSGFWRDPRRRLAGDLPIENARLVVLVIDLGHRREVYRWRLERTRGGEAECYG